MPWDKALYLDTALYLDRRTQLYQTTSKEVKYGDGEDHPEDEFVEPKFELVPGTLEHITELMVEKVKQPLSKIISFHLILSMALLFDRISTQELRVRLPLPELEVLMEPL